MDQDFISQLRFRLVDVVQRIGSGRAFAHSGNPSLHVVTWSLDWDEAAWDANVWAFDQGLFRGREFYVSPEAMVPAVDDRNNGWSKPYRIVDGLSLADVFVDQYESGTSQLDPVLAAEDAAKWRRQVGMDA